MDARYKNIVPVPPISARGGNVPIGFTYFPYNLFLSLPFLLLCECTSLWVNEKLMLPSRQPDQVRLGTLEPLLLTHRDVSSSPASIEW